MTFVRKISVIGLSATILLTQITPVLAESIEPVEAVEENSSTSADQIKAEVSREKAISLAKSYMTIPEGYILESVRFNSNEGNEMESASWRLSFNKEVEDRYYGNINVSIDADTGQLLNFSIYDNGMNEQATYPPEVDSKEAVGIAEQFIQKMNPDIADQLVFDQKEANQYKPPLQGNIEYPLSFHRIENDIIYEQNYIRMSIDGEGHITQYRFEWTNDMEFTDPSNIISNDEAQDIFNLTKPQLLYVLPYQSTERKPYISYSLSFEPIDAVTGEPLQPNQESEQSEPLTTEPLAAMPAGNLQLNKEQAIERIHAFFTIPEEANLEDASFSESLDQQTGITRAYWNFQWTLENIDDASTARIGARVDSDTGEILDYDHYTYEENLNKDDIETTNTMTQATAEEEAVKFIKEVLPHYSDQLVLEEPEQLTEVEKKNISSYRIIFNRVIDHVRADSDRVRITYDAKTGDISDFNNNISDIDYPQSKPETITEQEAKETLLSQYDLELRYEWVPEINSDQYSGLSIEKYNVMLAAGVIQPGEMQELEVVAKPVYRMVMKEREERVFLDAVEGVWRSMETAEVTSLEEQEVTDIEGHWAEHELSLMLEYDALEVMDGTVSPDQAISRGEMIKMLVIAIQGGNRPFYYNLAAKEASFDDVSQDSAYFAYVETAVDMNLLDSEEEKFQPEDTISREGLAKLIVKALGYGKLSEVEGLFLLEASDEAAIDYYGQVAIVTSLGIMTLNSNDSFLPDDEVTRAQAATAFYRFLQKREELRDNMEF